MKKMNKLLLVLLCAVTVGSTLEARRGGGRRGGHRGGHRGGRGGFHHRGGGWGHRGWRGGFWGGGYRPWFGLGYGPSVVVSDSTSYAPRRPSSLDAFINQFGRNPYSVREFCNWVNRTNRSQRQCDLYSAYRG